MDTRHGRLVSVLHPFEFLLLIRIKPINAKGRNLGFCDRTQASGLRSPDIAYRMRVFLLELLPSLFRFNYF